MGDLLPFRPRPTSGVSHMCECGHVIEDHLPIEYHNSQACTHECDCIAFTPISGKENTL